MLIVVDFDVTFGVQNTAPTLSQVAWLYITSSIPVNTVNCKWKPETLNPLMQACTAEIFIKSGTILSQIEDTIKIKNKIRKI